MAGAEAVEETETCVRPGSGAVSAMVTKNAVAMMGKKPVLRAMMRSDAAPEQHPAAPSSAI